MKTLSVMGSATTEMCKPVLMEIGRTIGAYDRRIAQNRAVEMANGTGTHEVRTNEEELSEGASQGDLQRHGSFGRVESQRLPEIRWRSL